MAMDTREKRKSLQRAYKEADEMGCVSLYENHVNGKYLIIGEPNRHGAESRFQFSKSIGSCAHMLLTEDWKIYGPDAFTLTILDTLKKDPEQTLKEFKEELAALADMYRTGRPEELSY
jgi:hypothetical protein